MKKTLRFALGALALSSALAAVAQSVYNPTRPAKDQGISFSSWGGGTIAETDETAFEGTTSIRVSSRNFFQGGIATFSTPVNLASAYSDRNNLLQFVLRVPVTTGNTTTTAPGGGKTSGGGSGRGPGRGGGGLAGGGGNEGGGTLGGGSAGGAGGSTPIVTTMTSDKNLETLRIVVTTTDGLRSEGYMNIKDKVADQRGWIKTGIPLQAITGFDRTNKIVQSIALAGDAVATFYVGEINTLNDSTPIYGELNETDMNLALGDERTLIANGYGGSSPLKYEWDFDSKDGIQVDAVGPVIKRKFRKPGKYVITCTISDVYGLKKPFVTTLNVEVNP